MTVLNVDSRLDTLRIVRHLEEGLLGDTYEAYDEELKETFAVKVLKREFVDEPNFSDQFGRECQVISQLENDAVTGLDRFDVTKWKHWLRYEFFEGFEVEGNTIRTLKDYLEAHPDGLPEEEVVFLVGQMLQALRQAHGIGLLHRNLKPSNVLLRRTEDDDSLEIKISDFSLVRLVGEERFRELWQSGEMEAKAFVSAQEDSSPEEIDAEEQTLGVAAETWLFRHAEERLEVTGEESGDFFAVAAMAHWALTGKILLEDRQLNLSAEVNPGWRAWILRGTEPDSGECFRDADEALGTLPRAGTSLRYAEMPFEREGFHLEDRSSPFKEGKDRSTDGAEAHLRETAPKTALLHPWLLFFGGLAGFGLGLYGLWLLYLSSYHTPGEWYECDRFIDQYKLKFGLSEGVAEWRGEFGKIRRTATGSWTLDDEGNYHLHIKFLKGKRVQSDVDSAPLRAVDIMFKKEGTLDQKVLTERYKSWEDVMKYDSETDRFSLLKRITPNGEFFPGVRIASAYDLQRETRDDNATASDPSLAMERKEGPVKLYDKESFDSKEVERMTIHFIPSHLESKSTK
jgi:serine/threonine protein kinase